MSEPAWGEHLERLRAAGFVGRAAPLAAIKGSVEGVQPQRVHLVHGPGGIGKTSLLDAAERVGHAATRAVLRLDARDVVGSPDTVMRWYQPAAGAQTPALLLIDGYELLAPLDEWFRAVFLPALPSETVTVLAGRAPPSDGWWLDAGWRALAATHELEPLDAADSDSLLGGLGVPQADRSELIRLSTGHPLVLVLLAEASRRRPGLADFADAPDVVSRLCARIMDDVPTPAHRLGLATCAHAAQATQDLLRRTVGDDAEPVWAWLAARPYVRQGPFGLYLHDVVRGLFEAEFRHRSPEAYLALHRTVREYFAQRVDDPGEPHSLRAATEILLLHRHSPLGRDVADLPSATVPPVERATAADHGWMLDLLQRTQGERTARLAARWFAGITGSAYRIVIPGGTRAFAYHGYLDASPDDLDDPVATAIWNLVDAHGALRPGERIHVNRFAGVEGGLTDPLMLLVNGTSNAFEWRRQTAAWTFLVAAAPEHYGPFFEYLGMRHMLNLDLGDGPVGGWGWDRRRLDVDGMFEMMAQRELSGEGGPPPAELLKPAPLSRAEFDLAVRAALTALRRPDVLAGSPLLGTALTGASEPGDLAEVLLATIAGLSSEPRGAEHRRVLERTYLRGAPSQEAAAELLDLPFSTYRRHLAQAVQRLCDVLWAVEIGAVSAARIERNPMERNTNEQKVSKDRPGA